MKKILFLSLIFFGVVGCTTTEKNLANPSASSDCLVPDTCSEIRAEQYQKIYNKCDSHHNCENLTASYVK